MSWDDPTDQETMTVLEPQAGEQLERVIARYARVRLEPSPAQARRARATVMEAAWRARIEAPSAAARHSRRPFAGWSARRIGLAATAAVLAGLCIGTSAFASSRAGGPLYGARIAFENATLPADPEARLQAQLANVQVRLAEVFDAETRGDQPAMTAALAAYETDTAVLGASTGASAAQALAAVEQHREVLLAIIARAPAAALPGLNQAIASSDNAIDRLTATDAGENGNGGNGNGGGNGGSGNGNGGNGVASPAPSRPPAVTPKPGKTPDPAATPKPVKTPDAAATPKPVKTPDAAVTPKPAHTPKPAKTPDPAATPKPAHTPNPGNGGNAPASRNP